jgi:hypothetical protein
MSKELTMGELARYEPTDKERIKQWAKQNATAAAIRHRLIRFHDFEDDYKPPSVEEIEKIIKETD